MTPGPLSPNFYDERGILDLPPACASHEMQHAADLDRAAAPARRSHDVGADPGEERFPNRTDGSRSVQRASSTPPSIVVCYRPTPTASTPAP
jgi:hypothetical protein